MPYTRNNFTRIHYDLEGEGPPLLLYHGLSHSLDAWREAGWTALLKRHFRLILIDGRGHGRSDKPHRPEAYAFSRQVGDIIAVLNDLEIRRAHYLGFSLGGWLGFGLARFAPGRLRSLVLLGAHPYAENMAFFRNALVGGLEPWVKMIDYASGGLSQPLQRVMLSNDLVALQAAIANDRPDYSDVLPTTFHPTLLCVGMADARLRAVQRCAEAMSRAQLVAIPDYNHFQIFLQPQATVGRIVEFLNEVEQNDPFTRLASDPHSVDAFVQTDLQGTVPGTRMATVSGR